MALEILVNTGSGNWRHQSITWTNVDLSSVRSLGFHLRASSLDDVKIPINKTRLKIAVLKWHLGLPGANELIMTWQFQEPGHHQSWLNSLWPRDAIWRHQTGLTLVQGMGCCPMAPSHYLHQWWLVYLFSFKRMNMKMLSAKWNPFCSSLNMLSLLWIPVAPLTNMDK